MNKLLTIKEAADRLGHSMDTLRRWDKNGHLPSSRKNNKDHRRYLISDIEIFSEKLDRFKIAKYWTEDKKGFEPLPCYFCSDSFVFQSRLLKLGKDLTSSGQILKILPLLMAVVGEIGNNSFDHNLGNWPDIGGIFLAYDINKKMIVLADRGQGVLKTLKRVKRNLKTHKEALKTAFTEVISGRSPENRGNGLKFVRSVVVNNKMKLFFQTGNAVLNLKNQPSLIIHKTEKSINGCLVKITF